MGEQAYLTQPWIITAVSLEQEALGKWIAGTNHEAMQTGHMGATTNLGHNGRVWTNLRFGHNAALEGRFQQASILQAVADIPLPSMVQKSQFGRRSGATR